MVIATRIGVFLLLVHLPCRILEVDIAQTAGISTSHISIIFITLVDLLHARLRAPPIWPTRDTVNKTIKIVSWAHTQAQESLLMQQRFLLRYPVHQEHTLYHIPDIDTITQLKD